MGKGEVGNLGNFTFVNPFPHLAPKDVPYGTRRRSITYKQHILQPQIVSFFQHILLSYIPIILLKELNNFTSLKVHFQMGRAKPPTLPERFDPLPILWRPNPPKRERGTAWLLPPPTATPFSWFSLCRFQPRNILVLFSNETTAIRDNSQTRLQSAFRKKF